MIKNECSQQKKHHCGSENRKGGKVVVKISMFHVKLLTTPSVEFRLNGCLYFTEETKFCGFILEYYPA